MFMIFWSLKFDCDVKPSFYCAFSITVNPAFIRPLQFTCNIHFQNIFTFRSWCLTQILSGLKVYIHFQFLFCLDCPDIEPSLYQTLEMSKPFVSSTPMKYEKSDASLLTTCTYTEVPCADFDPEAGGISLCIDKNGTACWPARVYRIISQNKDLLLNAYIYMIWWHALAQSSGLH